MHQSGVVALSQKIQQMQRRIHVGRKGVSQIGIKIRQPRAVHNQVE